MFFYRYAELLLRIKNIHNQYEVFEASYISSKDIPEYNEILQNINNLSNHILSNASSKKLIRYGQYFIELRLGCE
jgi:hypothetical protein